MYKKGKPGRTPQKGKVQFANAAKKKNKSKNKVVKSAG